MEKVRIDIATVGAQQATKDTKTLKEQIKDLRNELGNLTQGTDEYNQKIQELGNLMHQQSEITQQAKLSTEDYGQTLSNLTSIASGVVGSITAINGVMNLVGANNEDAMKAVKTMTSLMGIIQGLSALDNAEKAFKGLWNRIKLTTTATKQNTVATTQNAAAMTTSAAATTAQGVAATTATRGVNLLSVGFKRLGLAIKSFMMSNPFTLILVAVTTIYAIISNIIDKQKQATEELKKQAELIKEYNINNQLSNTGTSYTSGEMETRGRALAQNNGLGTMSPYDRSEMEKFNQDYLEMKERLDLWEQMGYKYEQGYADDFKKLANLQTKHDLMLINWYESTMQGLRTILADNPNDTDARDKLKAYTEEVQKLYIAIANISDNRAKYAFERGQHQVQEAEKEREKQRSAWEKQKSKDQERLNKEYQYEKKLVENLYAEHSITTEEYYNRLLVLEKKNYEEQVKWIKKYVTNKKEQKRELEILEAEYNGIVIKYNQDLARELNRIWANENDPSTRIASELRERDLSNAQREIEQNREMHEAQMGDVEKFYERQYEIADKWLLDKYLLIERYNQEEVEAEYEKKQKILEIERDQQLEEMALIDQRYGEDTGYENERYNFELQNYKDQLDKKLISQAEYNEKVAQLEEQHNQTLNDLHIQYLQDRADADIQFNELMYQLQENEYNHEVELFNRKMNLTKQYLQAFSTMVGGVQGLLTELQGAYEQGTKEYQAIEEANIIMSGITGALQAWQSGMAAAPAPYNLIIAAAMAGISTATTIAALANLKSKKLSSGASGASINVSPYEAYSAETSAELNGNIQDQRVYVVEQDITDTVNRVNVAETEASF